MQRLAKRHEPSPYDRASRVIVWLGIAAGFGVSLAFLALAGWSFVHHEPALRIAGPIVLAVMSAGLALVRLLGRA